MSASKLLFALALAASVQVAAQTVPDTLEQRLLACAACHGRNGEGQRKNEYFPRLAGKPAGYLYNQLLNYRELRRQFPIMNYMVAYLSDAYLAEIAEHYAMLQPPYPPPARAAPALLARGGRLVTQGDPARNLPACTSCHGTALTGLAPAIPGLVGLYADYIAAQMGAWKEGKRHSIESDCMREVARKLMPEDIGAVSAYLAAQPATGDMKPAPAGSLKLPLECGGLARK